jgi:hypothetical protein
VTAAASVPEAGTQAGCSSCSASVRTRISSEVDIGSPLRTFQAASNTNLDSAY